jgi:hypothetical protein
MIAGGSQYKMNFDFDEEILEKVLNLCRETERSYRSQDSSWQEDEQAIDDLITNLLALQDSYSSPIPESCSDVQTQKCQQADGPSKRPKLAAAHQLGDHIASTSRQNEVGEETTMSLKKFALYAVENAKDENDLMTIEMVFTSHQYLCLALVLSSSASAPTAPDSSLDAKKQLYKDALENKFRTEHISRLLVREVVYKDDSQITKLYAHGLFSSTHQLRKELKIAFEREIERTSHGQEYIQGLVRVYNEEAVSFPTDLGKSKACIISGESGSGKSWFATRCIPGKFPNASVIYYELSDDDMQLQSEWNDFATAGMRQLYKDCIRELRDQGQMRTEVYDAICELSRRNNVYRNDAAVAMMVKCVQKTLRSSPVASSWWRCLHNEATCETLDELIIIFDEVGKIPEFALGLVDEVRHTLINIHNRGLAKNTMLVLVGSGLDGYIADSNPDFPLMTLADRQEYRALQSFGTDPSKSDLVRLCEPILDDRIIRKVKMQDIKRGTYSNVLATNTRMLLRGVIPIMTDEKHMMSVTDLSSRRIELGSTNIVMDYAARIYIRLNGLGRLQKSCEGMIDKLLLKQFLLIQQDEIGSDDWNPASEYIRSCKGLSKSDYIQALRFGIVAADVKKTSPALRYLACDGQTAPLHSQSGVAFEVILQHHLARFSTAIYVLGCIREKSNYLCTRYELVQAWPPASTRGDSALSDERTILDEVDRRYGVRNLQESHDITEIASRIAGYDEFDLVMRQSVSNAQGADVMVLSKRLDGHLFLDLYQAKHHSNTLSGPGSQSFRCAFASLGVSYNKQVTLFDTAPKSGAAGYSYLGTQKLVEELEEKFREKVEIRHRVVVLSNPMKALQQANSWRLFPWEKARKTNVWIWCREMLEPTVSVLSPSQARYD